MMGPNSERFPIPFGDFEGGREEKRELMMEMVDTLLDLEEASHPETTEERASELVGDIGFRGEVSAHFLAKESLYTASSMLNNLAGWAIHHEIGLAALGIELDYDNAEEIDSFGNEAVGETLAGTDQQYSQFWQGAVGEFLPELPDKQVWGKAEVVQRLLGAVGGYFLPERLWAQINDEIEGLKWGEEPALFVRKANWRKQGARYVWPYKLYALQYIEYWLEVDGRSRTRSAGRIAEAYDLHDIETGTITKEWLRGAKKAYGAKMIEHLLEETRARAEGARITSDMGRVKQGTVDERLFNDEGLKARGQGFKTLMVG